NDPIPQKVASVQRHAAAAPVLPAISTRRPKSFLIAFAVITLLLLGGVVWFFARQTAPKSTNPAPPLAAPSVTTAATIPEKSVAVLPFENLSRDPDNAFFTDGVQDEILTDLAKIADLKVISRTSVMQYKSGAQRNLREIGQQLGVAHLLEGSVQRAANRIRVNAQ